MVDTFRYEGQRLVADVSRDLLPKAVSLIKDYLTSRLYSKKEKQENPMDFMDRTLKSMPNAVAFKVIENPTMLLMKRERALQVHEQAAGEIAAIPDDSVYPPYQGEINITRGYRPANVAQLKIEANGAWRALVELHFTSSCGDETRPLWLMQYSALLTKAQEAGFGSDKGSMDAEVSEFANKPDSYFRTGPINEVMSAFDWSELEAAVNFLWPNQLPEDIRAKLGK
ncbi:MAG TPA: hypothetical protein VJA18_00140 [Candidatus Nanoarchaeia archaeon]|nr:hypothetical protein [Candidatus Nanoarchaeia archaeon]